MTNLTAVAWVMDSLLKSTKNKFNDNDNEFVVSINQLKVVTKHRRGFLNQNIYFFCKNRVVIFVMRVNKTFLMVILFEYILRSFYLYS